MSVIIGLSGKKQSGKSSLANYLQAYLELKLNKVPDNIIDTLSQSIDGTSCSVKDVINTHGVTCSPRDMVVRWGETIHDHVKVYSFADPIKEFCIEVLGITPEQVYGTDEQKNVPTKYLWDKMPNRPIVGYKTELVASQMEYVIDEVKYSILKEGPMTAREIMQVFGTDIMRNMFSSTIWVDACIRKIQKENPTIAIIADLRFPSELEAVVNANGYIVRLGRKMFEDNHPSETSLDDVDWRKYENACVVPHVEGIHIKNLIVKEWVDSKILPKVKENNVNIG